jgi:hypothetical protein
MGSEEPTIRITAEEETQAPLNQQDSLGSIKIKIQL